MTDSTITVDVIDEKMMLFDKYLERTNMDKKAYQYEGVKWCLKNELNLEKVLQKDTPKVGDSFALGSAQLFPKVDKVDRGGFIADEMGLGKTIMMIGTMVSNYLPRTLIILPPVLIDQWYLQIYRTTGHKPLIYHGANKKRLVLIS